jgi:hypothetical protein
VLALEVVKAADPAKGTEAAQRAGQGTDVTA